jgi:FkbH-like protein
MEQGDGQGDVRSVIDAAVAAGDVERARQVLMQVWREKPGAALARFIAAHFAEIAPRLSLAPCRLAVLRSFTLEPLVPMLRAAAFVDGIDLDVQLGDFNAYTQDVIAPERSLYRFDPQIVILAVQTRDVAPDLWDDFVRLSSADVTAAIERVVAHFRGLLEAFRARSAAHLIVHTLDTPPMPATGILDAQEELSQQEAVRRINAELRHLAAEHRGVYILDYDALIARHGRLAWYDERKWLSARLPISAGCLIHVAHEWLRFIHPLVGRSCKALVVDLDNTLWGGVIGEDGLDGIKVGPENPGASFQALQRAILDLYERGVILAIASKNNPADALEALEGHAGMLLRPHHFAALRINWNDKAQNLREIAAELNIGTDALAFLDDNPVERQWVRSQLPEVRVIELPPDASEYAGILRASPVFEQLSISAEDRERGRYYADQRLRTELQQSTASLAEFYESLQLSVEIAGVAADTLARTAQLTQKTNQFNLTTRRLTEQQIAATAADPDASVYTVRVRDRFGDNGLVGVAIARREGPVCEIDTFLLSCRVMCRTVESAVLATIAEEARAAGAERLIGWYVATKKNAAVADFYRSHGFTCTADQNGESRWEFDLLAATITPPAWIERRILRERVCL